MLTQNLSPQQIEAVNAIDEDVEIMCVLVLERRVLLSVESLIYHKKCGTSAAFFIFKILHIPLKTLWKILILS